jgi:predicted kinase
LTGNALNALVNAILGAVADAGQGAVVDANFNNIWQANAVRQFVALRRPRCFEVCLWADPDVLRRRFVERDDPPLTDALRPYFETVLLRDRTPVLGPPVPTAEFDTSEFATLDASRRTLVAQIRAALDL